MRLSSCFADPGLDLCIIAYFFEFVKKLSLLARFRAWRIPCNTGEMDLMSDKMWIPVTRCTASHARNLPGVEARDSWGSDMAYQQHFQCFTWDPDAVTWMWKRMKRIHLAREAFARVLDCAYMLFRRVVLGNVRTLV